MQLIAAVDRNWAIGKNNQILVRIPADQKFFREVTTGKVVVMGRKTLESFPNGMPLKNRTNIVLTRNPDYQVKDAIVVHSMDELHEELKKYNSDDVFIIGGEKIYEQMLDECDVAHITKIEFAYDADAAKKTIVETTSRYFELSRKLTCGKTMVVQCDGFNYIE